MWISKSRMVPCPVRGCIYAPTHVHIFPSTRIWLKKWKNKKGKYSGLAKSRFSPIFNPALLPSRSGLLPSLFFGYPYPCFENCPESVMTRCETAINMIKAQFTVLLSILWLKNKFHCFTSGNSIVTKTGGNKLFFASQIVVWRENERWKRIRKSGINMFTSCSASLELYCRPLWLTFSSAGLWQNTEEN